MTELTWEGKYKDNKKVTPVRIALPFQTIETVNESVQQRQKTLDFISSEPTSQYGNEWRNRLIWGDKKYVLPSLLPEFAGKVDLIYIDPPFDTGENFSFIATIPDNTETEEDDDEAAQFIKQPSMIEQKAFRDTWGVTAAEKALGKTTLDKYLQWFYETIILLRELLSAQGTIYVHLDYHVGNYCKSILDEIFGYENCINQITWKRSHAHGNTGQGSKHFGPSTDMIFLYSKSDKYNWNQIFIPYTEEALERDYKYIEKDGRPYRLVPVDGPGGQSKGNPTYEFLGIHGSWRFSKTKMQKMYDEGLIVKSKTGKSLSQKKYLENSKGKALTDLWDDVWRVAPSSNERVDYATQKPEALLERIIKVSTNEGDLVLDSFCGSGTTAAVAEKLNRRWITCDLGRFSIHTARKRFLAIENIKPFIVQNLGKYERQQWMNAEFANPEDRLLQERTYKHFITDLYHAKPLDGYIWLHGAKAGRMIHVGNVEAPITIEDIKATIKEFWKMIGKEKSVQTNGIDFLGWDFAFDVNETAKQFAAENKVNVSFKKIPREVLEKKAVEQGDIKFYELASLDVKIKADKKKIKIILDNFIIPPDDVPQEVQGKITHWSQWIDYWAVDWKYKDDTFHNEWQSYRTKQNAKLELSAITSYNQSGQYTILVKVIDILGNDTTKAIHIKV